jgi:hypothetical protein
VTTAETVVDDQLHLRVRTLGIARARRSQRPVASGSYNRRLRALTPQLVWAQQRLSELLATGKLRLADGTLVGVANYAGCAQRSEFAGVASL